MAKVSSVPYIDWPGDELLQCNYIFHQQSIEQKYGCEASWAATKYEFMASSPRGP